MSDYSRSSGIGNYNACLLLNITTHIGIWQSENPFIESIPHFVTQLASILLITRSLSFLLKPLHPPRMVADIIGGILLGPSAFGRTRYFPELFPTRTINMVETLAQLALILHMFIVGLQTNLKPIVHSSKKVIAFAAAGFSVSISIGIGLFFLMRRILRLTEEESHASGCVYWAVALTITGFPVVAQIITKLKLLQTEIGRLSMHVALLSDLLSWVVFTIALPICFSPKNSPFAITATVAFIVLSVYVFRPALIWVFRRASKGHNNNDNIIYNEYNLCFVLVGAVICSIFTGGSGTHQVIGAYVFGLILPGNELRLLMMERFEDFVSGLMMPVFFTVCGTRINVFRVVNWWLAAFVVILAGALKVAGSLLVSTLFSMPIQEGLAIGLVMNTKGILALVMFNIGWDEQILRSEEYAVMIVAILIMTMVTAPVISIMYKRSKSSVQYKQRTIQNAKPYSELRILTCIHSLHNVPAIINLLDLANAKKKSSLCVFPLYLVQLTSHASAVLIVHSFSRNNHTRDVISPSNQIINAFEKFENHSSGVSIQPLTVVSHFVSMHEDICGLAEDKRVAFLIIPFHKRSGPNDTVPNMNPVLQKVNEKVLDNTPCSVGMLVDHGAGEYNSEKIQHIAVIFIGGPDDREALAYAWRMVRHPSVRVTLIRFLLSDEVSEFSTTSLPGCASQLLTCSSQDNRQRQFDDNYVNEFMLRTASEECVNYEEKTLSNVEETVGALKAMDHSYDLYIVGRGEGFVSPLTVGMLDWSDCPELGAIGDLLAGSNFVNGSVLVIKQYVGVGDGGFTNADSIRNGSVHSKELITSSLSKDISLGEIIGYEMVSKKSSRFDDDDDDDDDDYDDD